MVAAGTSLQGTPRNAYLEVMETALAAAGEQIEKALPAGDDEISVFEAELLNRSRTHSRAAINLAAYREDVTRALLAILLDMEREKLYTYEGFETLRKWADHYAAEVKMDATQRDYLFRLVNATTEALIPAETLGVDAGKLIQGNIRSLKEAPATLNELADDDLKREFVGAMVTGSSYTATRATGEQLKDIQRERHGKPKQRIALTVKLEEDGSFTVSGSGWSQNDLLYLQLVAPKIEQTMDTSPVVIDGR